MGGTKRGDFVALRSRKRRVSNALGNYGAKRERNLRSLRGTCSISLLPPDLASEPSIPATLHHEITTIHPTQLVLHPRSNSLELFPLLNRLDPLILTRTPPSPTRGPTPRRRTRSRLLPIPRRARSLTEDVPAVHRFVRRTLSRRRGGESRGERCRGWGG